MTQKPKNEPGKRLVAESGPFKVFRDKKGHYHFEKDDDLKGVTKEHLAVLVKAILEARSKTDGNIQFMNHQGT